jgi:hypothetical protein
MNDKKKTESSKVLVFYLALIVIGTLMGFSVINNSKAWSNDLLLGYILIVAEICLMGILVYETCLKVMFLRYK